MEIEILFCYLNKKSKIYNKFTRYMEITNTITEGQWFCAVEGIAIAEKISNVYYEEYDSIPQNKNMGDLKMSVVQYRLFCDFEGLPIRRNRFKYFNADCCSPMTEKWKRVLRKSISDNPKEYASFMKFLRVPKEVKVHVTLKYVVSEKDKDKVIRSMEAIRENLPPKFTFFDLKHIAEDNHCVINMNNFTDDVSYYHMYIRIFLVYTFGDSIGKRVLFHKLDYEIREK